MKTIGGYENRGGMQQYNRDTMVKVITTPKGNTGRIRSTP